MLNLWKLVETFGKTKNWKRIIDNVRRG